MTRRCSHCSHNGHNSRTCPTGGGGVKLFGVRLNDGSIIKKSASMGNLSSFHCHSASPNHGSISPDPTATARIHVSDGYLSDEPAQASCSTNRRGERKKGLAWTEEEHRLFLVGLQKMGKGDWRGIARNFVISRTPTQVASHAQKYFIRHSNSTQRKRRSSLFDMLPDTDMEAAPVSEEQLFLPPHPQSRETDNASLVPFLNLSLERAEPMEEEEMVEPSSTNVPPPVLPFYQASYLSVPFPFWSLNVIPFEEGKKIETSHHQVLKPIPVLPTEPVNVYELVGLSQLNLEDTTEHHRYLQREPSPLSLKLIGASRQSAFHVNAPVSKPDISDGKSSVIQAVRNREERG